MLGGYDCNVVPADILPYIQLMSRVQLIAILLLVSPAMGQQNGPVISFSTREPKLPVIDHDACLGSTDPIPDVKIVKDDTIYSSPDNGKFIAKVRVGERVTVLSGANVIRQPDRAVIKYVSPDDAGLPPLKVGDTILGYGWHADGNMVFWAKGRWLSDDIETVAENGACGFTSGFGPSGCTIDIVKDGVIEWWIKVKTSSGASGWVLAVRYNKDNRWYRWNGNFYDLLQGHCNLD